MGGDDRAYASLGELYLNGEGVPKDYDKAREYLEKATDEGGRVFWDLGVMYAKGLGVLVDKAQAAKYYQLACDKGYEKACTTLSK